ncbi:hypothetical protein GCM10017691_16250 [Pseudonocardia petroleophila]|uniref:PE domain-containing protein n=1 Tax=Pseudonocardia petroleophila TaxID=37331 RepID=A0A7G7MHP4_9PSEU|nr:PE domain-containing protein [Pseudonocardia petroleophila]QNG52305.1 PE domain-containing protein [Pseudonocardia petroleophila]
MADDGGGSTDEADLGHAAVTWARSRLAAPVEGGGRAGGFVVDPERAEACIAELTRITNELRMQVVTSNGFRFDAPGNDEVSLNLAANGAEMSRRAEGFLQAWAAQIEATRDALQDQLDAYRSVETSNSGLLA